MADEQKSFYAGSLKVLIVEDSEVDRRILESMLYEPTCHISSLKTTASLNSAIKEIETNQFDVVVLDLNLPDSNGFHTLTAINKKFPHLAIVVNTGAYEDSVGIKALSLGAQDFLLKGKYTTYLLNKTLRYALERKRLEKELIKTHEELRETQAQLIHSEKMKIIGALASGVAHEVKNPLAVILYGITYLEHHLQKIDDQTKMVLGNIKDAVERANLIVTDLLNFASLSHFKRHPESVNDIIEKSLNLVKHELEKHNIEVNKNLKEKLPLINIDRTRIEQVLINLMLNAVQAMNKGGKLFLSTNIVSLPKDYQRSTHWPEKDLKPGDNLLVINVEDSGPGISQENLPKIFEPFFTTKRGKGGIGLGLAVSRNIMQIHDGYIHMENKKEGGARATLIFKLN